MDYLNLSQFSSKEICFQGKTLTFDGRNEFIKGFNRLGIEPQNNPGIVSNDVAKGIFFQMYFHSLARSICSNNYFLFRALCFNVVAMTCSLYLSSTTKKILTVALSLLVSFISGCNVIATVLLMVENQYTSSNASAVFWHLAEGSLDNWKILRKNPQKQVNLNL